VRERERRRRRRRRRKRERNLISTAYSTSWKSLVEPASLPITTDLEPPLLEGNGKIGEEESFSSLSSSSSSFVSSFTPLSDSYSDRIHLVSSLGVENGEWRMENGEWRTENGEWRMEKLTTPYSCKKNTNELSTLFLFFSFFFLFFYSK